MKTAPGFQQHPPKKQIAGLPKEEIHFQLEELLGKEVKLLQTIDRLKITAARENKSTRTKETLEKMASPKEWASSEGDLVEVGPRVIHVHRMKREHGVPQPRATKPPLNPRAQQIHTASSPGRDAFYDACAGAGRAV